MNETRVRFNSRVTTFLLKEDGDALLLENGSHILTESTEARDGIVIGASFARSPSAKAQFAATTTIGCRFAT